MSQKIEDEKAVIIFRFLDSNPLHWHFDVTIKMVLMAVDSVLYEQPVKGFVFLVDLKNMGILHLTKLKLLLLRKVFKAVNEGLFKSLKAVHFINAGWVFDHLFKIFQSICSKEVLALIHVHEGTIDWEKFYKETIEKKYLPSDYGGDDISCKELAEILWKKMEDIQEYYDEEEKDRKYLENIYK